MSAPESTALETSTGIDVVAEFFPLAFLLFLCAPVIEIDGVRHPKTWGRHRFDVPPGEHTVKVYFPYLTMRECGANSRTVTVEPGKRVLVKWYMWPLMIVPGEMSVVVGT